jgi:PAS domain S-box-containing protein
MSSPQAALNAATQPASRAFPLAEIVITILYVVFGAVWVIGTDTLVSRFLGEPRQSVSLQTLKGLNFVVTTGVLYYLVLRRSFHRRRRAEAATRLEQERFELAARAATDAIWDLDVKAGKLWWSDGMEKLFGYSKAEAGDSLDFWTERLHPEEREKVAAGFHDVIAGTATLWADDYRFRCRDGHYAFVQDRGFVIRDADGHAVRMVGGMTDITRRKEAEQRLERSRRQLRALSARLESLREEERTRIAREIHDELGQLLTALKMDLRWMEKRLSSGENNPALNPILDKLVESVGRLLA